ncbi:MAG: uncharacterized protein JWR28_1941 [Modestobacter sp.]|jgi:uncharacterized protein YjbJ (UPF0337 family)|nr:uncharacterized protein [Modestobacter sp.]MCW2576402.1 uncharacterized protein [Modestobacter sp.]MCW2618792.1 uncharacterized protein [Modestobacter sp.]
MSLFGKAKAKAEELLGHAEEVYGQSHGDAAATLDGEARRLEGEAEEEQDGGVPRPEDDGLAGSGAR